MKIRIDFTKKHDLFNHIMNNFPFNDVQSVMEITNWRYFSDAYNTPTISKLKETLLYLLKDCNEGSSIATGGFEVDRNNGEYKIKFNTASFFYNQKSDMWDNEDTINFNDFCDKVYSVSDLLNNPLSIYTKEELRKILKEKCDAFFSGSSDEIIDNVLGLSFIRETTCEINFSPIERNY